jgi:hypothetical protein
MHSVNYPFMRLGRSTTAGGLSDSGPAMKGALRRSGVILAVILTAALPGSPASAGDVRGTVRLEPWRRLAGATNVSPDTTRAVVFLRGEGMVTSRRGGPLELEVRWNDDGPVPALTIARLHDRLRLTNAASTGRSLFVFSGSITVASGVIPPGGSTLRPLARFGPVEIYEPSGRGLGCVLVLENPFHKAVDADGGYLMDGVPPGSYEVCAWAPGRPVTCVPVEIPFEGIVEARISVP